MPMPMSESESSRSTAGGPPPAFSLKPLRLFGQRIRPWAARKHLRIAWGALLGQTVGDRFIVDYVSNRAELARYIEDFESDIPQARVSDDSVTRFDYIDWRAHFGALLSGEGLEIGALHDPMPVPNARGVKYLDKLDPDALRKMAPKLADRVGRVDILDDAQTLATVGDGTFDFVIAAHVIEHLRNPIGGVRQWLRVLRPSGRLYLVVPDKRRTFDRPRMRTTLEHLILDDRQPSAERDFEHFLDYAIHVHKSSLDPAIAEARRLEAEDHSIHFHTFIPQDIVALLQWMDAQVTPVRIVEGPAMSPDHEEFHILVERR
jgi:SAM-dependent methyltransferase